MKPYQTYFLLVRVPVVEPSRGVLVAVAQDLEICPFLALLLTTVHHLLVRLPILRLLDLHNLVFRSQYAQWLALVIMEISRSILSDVIEHHVVAIKVDWDPWPTLGLSRLHLAGT